MVECNGFTIYKEGDCLNYNFDVNVHFSHEVHLDQPRFNGLLKAFVVDFIKSYFSNLLGDLKEGDITVL